MSDWKPTYENKLLTFQNKSEKFRIEAVIKPNGNVYFQRWTTPELDSRKSLVQFRDFLSEVIKTSETAPFVGKDGDK